MFACPLRGCPLRGIIAPRQPLDNVGFCGDFPRSNDQLNAHIPASPAMSFAENI
jgi:hypothetical protein